MEQNWIIEQAKKADGSKDVVILENPEVRDHLDGLILNRFWPVIRNCLESSGYTYIPQENPETDFELSHILERSLSFMLFDGEKAFFRGKLICSIESWMIKSEHFLALSKVNDPWVVFEILGNSRFAGNPPTLMIDKNRDDFYQITFHVGSGAGWRRYDEQYIEERIKKTINVNVEMYDFSKEGFISPQDIGDFLSIAYEVYEAF